jgi:hypothetical protein
MKDAYRALSFMFDAVSTMLKDPFRDVYGLFPGLGIEEPRAAAIHSFQIGFNLYDTQLSCFHSVMCRANTFAHKDEPPYFGTNISLAQFNADAGSGQSNLSIPRPLVRLTVKTYDWTQLGSQAFTSHFFDKRSINLSRHFHSVISQTEGFHLPITGGPRSSATEGLN